MRAFWWGRWGHLARHYSEDGGFLIDCFGRRIADSMSVAVDVGTTEQGLGDLQLGNSSEAEADVKTPRRITGPPVKDWAKSNGQMYVHST